MDFQEYQKKSRATAFYPKVGENFVYPTLGLCGETGEVAEKVKKIFRDNGGVLDDNRRREIEKELGDILWYMAQVATEMGLDLGKIAEDNIQKLSSRKERGTLGGDGDDR
ncbi:MAG: nucleoside triphosphate pyrophosphohydrolase family protein [Patescibacteria group bacterium]|nr:nucleoside triphosphate pyrophosphohydrolase family protein [Patescibacteria group bacterium]MDD5490614.1 nucleoside triphosphate pyrophosphohydrolase family protein [Patescibacteria group bacterium]